MILLLWPAGAGKLAHGRSISASCGSLHCYCKLVFSDTVHLMAAPTSAVFGVAGMVAPDRLVSQLGLEKFTCSSGYSLRTDVLRGGVRLEEGPFQVRPVSMQCHEHAM